jgi:hypothetical protein
VAVSVQQNLPKVPASAINTGALAKGFQYELTQKLAADGLDAQVSVVAKDLSRRRRLHQAGTSQIKYSIVVMVPAGQNAEKVRGPPAEPRAGALTGAAGPYWSHVHSPMPHPPAASATCALAAPISQGPGCCPPLQVMIVVKAAAKAVATDRAILRRLLQLCLPANLFSSLNIDELIDAMIASTVVEAEIADPGASTPSPKPATSPSPSAGTSPKPAAASPPGQSASISVSQTLPGVPASAVDAGVMASGMGDAINKGLAADGLTATVTATVSDSPASGRRLQQVRLSTSAPARGWPDRGMCPRLHASTCCMHPSLPGAFPAPVRAAPGSFSALCGQLLT